MTTEKTSYKKVHSGKYISRDKKFRLRYIPLAHNIMLKAELERKRIDYDN